MSKTKLVEYTVLRDTREKKDKGWFFEPDNECLGTTIKKLDTGDYSLEGWENRFVLERKFGTSELATNIYEKRFEKELIRLENFEFPFMILEFNFSDVHFFPLGSGIPTYLFHKIAMNAEFMERTIARYMIQYRTKIIFAGKNGKEISKRLFHSLVKYGKPKLDEK